MDAREYDYLYTDFSVDFGAKESFIGKTARPLGHYATQALLLSRDFSTELFVRLHDFEERFQIYLAAATVSAAGAAQQALDNYWKQAGQLPGYREWLENFRAQYRIPLDYPSWFLQFVHDSAGMAKRNTPGSEEYTQMMNWLQFLHRLPEDLQQYQKNVHYMLQNGFSDPTKRSPKDYAQSLRIFALEVADTMERIEQDAELEGRELTDLDFQHLNMNPKTMLFRSKVYLSVVPNAVDSEDAFVTRISFPSWKDFIYMDLYRGLAAGNLPYICENCHRYFLVRGAYKTIFCERIAPGETKRTCRQVGGHIRERMKIDTDFARREYKRAYDCIKMRRYRGTMTEEEFEQEYQWLNELKDDMIDCAITSTEFIRRIQEQYPPRKKGRRKKTSCTVDMPK